MQQEVRIITFINDREGREDGERLLARLVNDGWEIKTAGGGTGADMVWGFVILQRVRPLSAEGSPPLDTIDVLLDDRGTES